MGVSKRLYMGVSTHTYDDVLTHLHTCVLQRRPLIVAERQHIAHGKPVGGIEKRGKKEEESTPHW